KEQRRKLLCPQIPLSEIRFLRRDSRRQSVGICRRRDLISASWPINILAARMPRCCGATSRTIWVTVRRLQAPFEPYAWLDLAVVENSMGHTATALDALARAAQMLPNDGEIAAALGFSYINLNKAAQAISPLRRAARLLPQDYLVQSQLGYCLLVTGQHDAAVEYLRRGASLK